METKGVEHEQGEQESEEGGLQAANERQGASATDARLRACLAVAGAVAVSAAFAFLGLSDESGSRVALAYLALLAALARGNVREGAIAGLGVGVIGELGSGILG